MHYNTQTINYSYFLTFSVGRGGGEQRWAYVALYMTPYSVAWQPQATLDLAEKKRGREKFIIMSEGLSVVTRNLLGVRKAENYK
jgi:hypothetical protein